ncbi:MAG: 16S rRNA (adenine(1518)-N(6)/adenine(1519)-N(6))-dimethyltransferase RsmA [Patescibacteria group bacterium]
MYEPVKSLGQNFLLDMSVVRDMVEALSIEDGDEIIEIGPGHGAITEILVGVIRGTKSKLYSVEIDERFYEKLLGMYTPNDNIKIINQNILDYLPNFSPSTDFKILGSLPYYITSPIIHSIIYMRKRPLTCVLLIQKEVAEKIKSRIPDSSYMSCFVQTFFNVSYIGKVPKNRFKPEPKVDGGLIKLTLKDLDLDYEFIKKYEGFLHKAFSNPRKMLNKMFSKEDLAKGNINPALRAQNLSADDWLSFYKVLNKVN